MARRSVNVYADLVRLPAVLSAPGDPLLGASTGLPPSARQTGTAIASSALAYMSGMALNDYADRHLDALERPHRPIPSGRLSSNRALAVGVGLLAADLLIAAAGNGRRGVAYSLATGSAVLAYDFGAKDTAAGPWVMAACRFLDVQRGSNSFRAALGPASLVAAHTYVITRVSRDEVKGGDGRVGVTSAVATAAIALRAVTTASTIARTHASSLVLATLATGLYAVPSIRASLKAAADPSPNNLQNIVKTGVMGMIPLQSALTAATGRTTTSAGLLVLWQAGRTLAVRRRVT